jgi:mRNA interferase RelE/StbE
LRRFSFHREALNSVRELAQDAKRFRQVMVKILALIENPEQPDARPLQGYEDYFRVDIGEYRIVYRYDDDDLWIEVVGKRNDDEVYRDLKRR